MYIISRNKISKMVFGLLIITFMILSYTLIFTNVYNRVNFLFAYLYYMIKIYTIYNLQKTRKDLGFLFYELGEMMVLFTAVILSYDIVVKFVILFGIFNGVRESKKQIDERKKQKESIHHISLHDELTGVYNRRYFQNALEKIEGMSVLRPISIIIGDINNLKEINDNLGHRIGDKYLKETADLIESVLRKGDIVARIGGDEFAIILLNTNFDECQRVLYKLQDACKNYTGSFGEIDIAFGYAVNTGDCLSLVNTMSRADKMMYKKKKEMKNT